MSHFFKVKSLEAVMALRDEFTALEPEKVPVQDALHRTLADDVTAPADMPGFRRATMDGFALAAPSSFGASESNPAWLAVQDTIPMGVVPEFTLAPGSSARISTGGMLPEGADAVVMVEHTQAVDEDSVEVYKSVAPLQNVIDRDEDFAKDQVVLTQGTRIRPQEAGLIAGMGISEVAVHRIPKVGIISTGDEIIPIDARPRPGQIRDINSYTLAGLIQAAGGEAVRYGIVPDDPAALEAACKQALAETDMVLLSGGSSVGTRDFTVEVLSELPDTEILVHGISISPGKPTILARSGSTPVWGLPGQVVSAMVVLQVVVIPFLNTLQGTRSRSAVRVRARLSRNVASAQGRRDFVRVMLESGEDGMIAKPVLGKSGLIRTMVHADGLLEIGDHVEGLEKDSPVDILLL